MNCLNVLFNGIIAFATVIAAGFAIYLYRTNKRQDNQKYWNDNLPVITIGSPCDVTQNACDIDITGNDDNNPNGSSLFQIGNFSKTTAWDIKVGFSVCEDCAKPDRELYIQEIPITTKSIDNIYQGIYIYSKYHINPTNKETSYQEYDICEILKECNSDTRQGCVKNLFLQCEYYSSPDHNVAAKINSKFKIKLECFENKGVKIKSIIRLTYKVG